MTKPELKKWLSKDLWSEAEFQALCCGYAPNTMTANQELNEALEAIRRAVVAKVISVIQPPDMSKGDEFYGHARFYTPASVIPWANKHFSSFPFNPEDVPTVVINTTGGKREKETILKMLGAIALLVAEKSGKYKRGDNPNALQIADEISVLLSAKEDFNARGLSVTNLRTRIQEGLELLQK